MSAQELILQHVQFPAKGLSVIRELIRIEVKVQIHPALFLHHISFVRTLLFIVPGNHLGENVELQIAVVILVVILPAPNFPDEFFGKAECGRCTAKELQMLLKQSANVLCAVVPAVHDQFDLFISQGIQLPEQFLNGLDIRNVSRKFPVIERQPGFFTKDQSQINLRRCSSSLFFPYLTCLNVSDRLEMEVLSYAQYSFSTRRFPCSQKKCILASSVTA